MLPQRQRAEVFVAVDRLLVLARCTCVQLAIWLAAVGKIADLNGAFSLVGKHDAKELIARADEDVDVMVVIVNGSPIAVPPSFPQFIAVQIEFAEFGSENLQ